MREKPKEVIITGIIGSVLLLIGIFTLFKEVNFQSQKDTKKYVKVKATLTKYEHTRTRRRGKGRTSYHNSYRAIYSYDDNGTKKVYKSPYSSGSRSHQTGDTVILYKNAKNGRLREGDFALEHTMFNFVLGSIFICISIELYKIKIA